MKATRYFVLMCAASLGLSAAPAQSAARVFKQVQIQQKIDQLLPRSQKTGSSGSTLGDYGTHELKLSLRSKSGGAEIHAHFDDIMVVLGGSATLITGGSVLDAKTDARGETKGKEIVNGVKQSVSKGDILHIPAGTPHQLILPPNGQFTAFVVKVHEP